MTFLLNMPISFKVNSCHVVDDHCSSYLFSNQQICDHCSFALQKKRWFFLIQTEWSQQKGENWSDKKGFLLMPDKSGGKGGWSGPGVNLIPVWSHQKWNERCSDSHLVFPVRRREAFFLIVTVYQGSGPPPGH